VPGVQAGDCVIGWIKIIISCYNIIVIMSEKIILNGKYINPAGTVLEFNVFEGGMDINT